jgi:branched-chain amino acid transport system permease protein
MRWRLLPTIVLILPLLGCAADERQIEICRQIVTAVIGDARDIAILPAEGEGVVRFDFASPAAQARHELTCRFAGAPLSAQRGDLMAVEQDGIPLSEIRMILLRHLLGLPTPAALLALPEPALPFAAHLAYLVQQLINGLSLGAIFALVAVGYSLVYGITGTIQFAYGEIFMIGAFAFITWFFVFVMVGMSNFGWVLALSFPIAAALTALNGWVTARIVYRPLLRAGRLNTLIGAIGLSMALREAVRMMQGTRYKWLPAIRHGRFLLFDGGGFAVYLAETQIAILALAVLATGLLAYLMMHTRWGRAHRACADDPKMAGLLGVDIWATLNRSFTIGAVLAALAGTAFTLQYGEADFFMGYFIGFKALTAALLGGFGTVTGALVGGLLLGLFEALFAGYFSSAYKDVAVFAVLALILIFRPSGLLGRSIASTNVLPAEANFAGRETMARTTPPYAER